MLEIFTVELSPFAPELFWILCLGFAIAFLLAFSVGANDVANSFGTSVGSRVLTVTQAFILATFFEVAGATLLGYSVCDTFRRKMYDAKQYEGSQKELMLGALACLIGSAAWNMIATALKMPISGTHSIVGATIGFSIVLRGWGSIKWFDMLRIVASWFVSPLLSGFISSIIYLSISKLIIRKMDPLKYGLKALPLFYGATIFINVASVVINGPNVLGLNRLPWYAGLLISLLAAGFAICCVAMIMVPKLRGKITDELVAKSNPENGGPKGRRPKPAVQKRTTSLSTPVAATNGAAESKSSAFDNVAFKPDETQPAGKDSETHTAAELTLDPNRLVVSSGGVVKVSVATMTSPQTLTTRPHVGPKPAHLLKRQPAQDQEELEEIDLDPPVAAPKPKRLNKPASDIEIATSGGGGSGGGDGLASGRPGMIRGERLEVFRLFSSLQILTACFASFAHGTNDVSNAVAPLVPIWNIFTLGYEDVDLQTQVWILAFGGIGICTGLWAWGRAVMSTVGDGLTQLTPSRGFSIELGAAISVLGATKLGLPISTTHCKVGSVVIVGLVSSWFCSKDNLLDMSEEERQAESGKQAVDWKLFGNIAITWIVTVPLAAAASASVMIVLRWLAL